MTAQAPDDPDGRPRATRSRGIAALAAAFGALLIAGYAVAHLLSLARAPGTIVGIVYLGAVLYLVFQFGATLFDRPSVVDADDGEALAKLEVVVLVPCFDEDPQLLRDCLRSLLTQSRSPQAVSVVDDGSTVAGLDDVREWFLVRAASAGVRAHWRRIENHGKRVAQVVAAEPEPRADIFVTVDSDSILDARAIEEGLKPFARSDVASVASIVLSANVSANALTRVMDLLCVTLQLVDRSALSSFGSVMVNAGACAFYRGDVLRENVAAYLTETFRGRRMQMSDDSMLTLFALRSGRAVHQTTAFAFTRMPETLPQHARQQLRWMRGSIIRSWWRFRYLPLDSPAFWFHAVKWIQYVAITALVIAMIGSGALFDIRVVLWSVAVLVAVQFALSARYLAVRRSDVSRAQTVLTYSLAPLSALWSMSVLRVLRWWAFATLGNVAWGTRGGTAVHRTT